MNSKIILLSSLVKNYVVGVPQDKKTHIVFSYRCDHRNLVQRNINRFVFADKNYFMHELSKLIIRKCENFILSPEVFETFTEEQVRALEQYFTLTMFDHSANLDDPKIFLFGSA
jgi:hypothetical protein